MPYDAHDNPWSKDGTITPSMAANTQPSQQQQQVSSPPTKEQSQSSSEEVGSMDKKWAIKHSTVSRIQFCGLIVSLYGFFYVSLGIFPGSENVFIPLLPALAFALIARPLLSFYYYGVQGTSMQEDLHINLKELGCLANWIKWLSIITWIIIGYLVAFFSQFRKMTFMQFLIEYKDFIFYLLIIFSIMGICDFIISYFLSDDWEFHKFLVPISRLLTCIFPLAAILFTYLITVHTLQMIGFFFSVVGIITSFLPAVLDVLGFQQS